MTRTDTKIGADFMTCKSPHAYEYMNIGKQSTIAIIAMSLSMEHDNKTWGLKQ